MSGSGAGVEGCRARPLSGGLWTLFSWLRRDEHCSSDSLSSVGSDRTAASFAFLPPGNYTHSPPLLITPAAPTDSYKKRVRDRNARRQYDRDITLLRKYGLHGYDAFSLPNGRRAERNERDRRAASEILQRRAHVPGKRRAPLPPSAPNSLPRPRKRPAPLPPVKLNIEKNNGTERKESGIFPMNSRRLEKPKHNDETMGCKPEKYSKKDSKESKPRQDKSFLKQIFENRKRNSAIETSPVKLLPSISELDKQAHEIIEKYKLKELEHSVSREERLDGESAGSSKRQVEAWICTRCLRKYNASVITCLYCLPLENALLNNATKSSKITSHATQTSSSKRSEQEDKEKLKEILKEMKDSLPKKPAPASTILSKIKINNETESKGDYPRVVEAPTLRIGSSVSAETNANSVPNAPSTSSKNKEEKQKKSNDDTEDRILATIENVVITQPVILEHTKDNIVVVEKASKKEDLEKQRTSNPIIKKSEHLNMTKTEIASKLLSGGKSNSNVITVPQPDISAPLKISSLFNPMYVPKSTTSSPLTNSNIEETKPIRIEKEVSKSSVSTNTENKSVLPSTSLIKPLTASILPPDNKVKLEAKKEEPKQSPKENIVIVKRIVEAKLPVSKPTEVSQAPETSIVDKFDQHSRRRNLINQLEQSIAKGDEKAAADAAVKLAQLRLSCSVLSFSSQIVSEASASSAETTRPKVQKSVENKTEDSPVKKDSAMVAPIRTKPLKTLAEDTKKDKVDKTVVKEENSSEIKAQASALEKSKQTSESNKPSSVKNEKALPVRCEPSTSRDINEKKQNEDVPILVWVEDKEATRGPVQLHVPRGATMGELRRRAEASLGLAVQMQRWIIDRALCSDDSTPLAALAGPELSAPFYLCLVESEKKEPEKTTDPTTTKPNIDENVYNELVRLEQQALVATTELFECDVCMEQCAPGAGVVLRECVHAFCRECLADMVRHSVEAVVACPAMGCRGVLQEREIKGLVSDEEYERWLARGLAAAESGARHAFHCRTRDCAGWALCEPGVRRFPCPVCGRTNCVLCQAIHEGETCDQHREKLQESSAADGASQTDEGTRALIESLIARGEALECPECSAIITKKWGCDWIKCSACKTEICWVTRGRRWGPAGRGDTSAGCRCGIDGKRCHPSCGYCH